MGERLSMGLSDLESEVLKIMSEREKRKARTNESDFQARQIKKEERIAMARRLAGAYAYANKSEKDLNKNYMDYLVIIGSMAFAGAIVFGRYLHLI